MAVQAKRARADGKVWIFLSMLSLGLILAMMAILAYLIAANSFLALWPSRVERVALADGDVFLGMPVKSDVSPEGLARRQYKIGNRDLNSGADFRWIYEKDIAARDYPKDAAVVARTENGDFFGFLKAAENAEGFQQNMKDFQDALAAYDREWATEAEPLRLQLAELGDEWQRTHFASLKSDYELERAQTEPARAMWQEDFARNRDRGDAIKRESETVMEQFSRVNAELAGRTAAFVTAAGGDIDMPLSAIISVTRPNALGLFGTARQFLVNTWHLLADYPREANTEGGLFPAIFGTVTLVFLMAISAFPLGVAAGVYLREYAKDGILSRTARVAINNLAGVPSIVYGIFGLGFFIYGMGGSIDRLFYPERVAAGVSTFGGGGIIWSSLTLGLLTLPIVIVATEEALATIPSQVREGSLALGATRFQTLWRVILPMASPGILTGFILAMARAAGEVAPLMLTGAVKSAHSLPLDWSWPFVHLDRKFMHLGFHIYDMGFQSPNVEASKPLVYLTALVLLVLVFVLNMTAFIVRKRMQEKYAMKGF